MRTLGGAMDILDSSAGATSVGSMFCSACAADADWLRFDVTSDKGAVTFTALDTGAITFTAFDTGAVTFTAFDTGAVTFTRPTAEGSAAWAEGKGLGRIADMARGIEESEPLGEFKTFCC